MEPRTRLAFLLLIPAQALHSVEEYVFRLFDLFGPARFVAGLVGIEPSAGFAIVNVGYSCSAYGAGLHWSGAAGRRHGRSPGSGR